MKAPGKKKPLYLEQKPGLLVLRLGQLKEELDAFWSVAAHRFTAESATRWRTACDTLESYKSFGGRVVQWSIGGDAPLETNLNSGKHQSSTKLQLQGRMQFVWELDIHPAGNGKPAEFVTLVNSSVKLEIYSSFPKKKAKRRASWCFETGDHQSPGCHFHVKIEESQKDPSKKVDVPRLPSILFMPTDTLDYLLGELWRDSWAEDVRGTSGTYWRQFPCHRLQTLLTALNAEMGQSGSPWMNLKNYKPPCGLFIGKAS